MPTSLQKNVFAYYELKKNQHTLSANLLHPTPAGLREECLHVYAEKKKNVNEPVLRRFFGPLDVGNDYSQRIRNCSADKFKPLANFLKGETSDTRDKNIELLAWLIDFTGQAVVVETSTSDNESSLGQRKNELSLTQPNDQSSLGQRNNEPSLTQLNDQTSLGQSNNNSRQPNNRQHFIGWFSVESKFRWTIAALMGVVMVVFGSYVFFEKSNQCMYWTGDEYTSIPCNEKADDAVIVALDTFKVAHLKRITRIDTITRNALGHVWYVKIKVDSADFYTAPGDYPANNKKRLLPMTDYILRKYILKKQPVK